MGTGANRRSAVVALLVTVVALAGSGCAAEPVPPPVPPPPPKPAPTWPLTGLPAPATPTGPVLAVKIDNTAAARPQLGLNKADLVVEELVEGGATRLAALYQSTLPVQVGPVRSVRTSDAGIVLPAGAALAASGGAPEVLQQLRAASVRVVDGRGPGFSRAHDRPVPYNVMLDVAAAGRSVPGHAVGPYLPWGSPAAGRPVQGADVGFSPAHTTSWSWVGDHWRREGDRAAAGQDFPPANLVIVSVPIRDAGYRDPAGHAVPETVLDGSGPAWVLAAGTAVEGRWAKHGLAGPLTLTGTNGAPLQVPPGRTWIELVPQSGQVRIR